MSDGAGISVAVFLFLAMLVTTCMAGRAARPLTDEERYFFNGEMDICIDCGKRLCRHEWLLSDGRLQVQVWCGKSGHEHYRWIE